MKKFIWLLLLFPLLASASGGGGFPSRPKFSEATIRDLGPGIRIVDCSLPEQDILFGMHWQNANCGGLAVSDHAGRNGGILMSTGNLEFSFDSGKTVGSTFTPTLRMLINSSGVNIPGLLTANNGIAVSGNATFSGLFSPASFVACETGYSRKSLNLCLATATNNIALVRDACTTIAAPATARSVIVRIRTFANAANSVAQRNASVSAFTFSTCATTLRIGPSAFAYEFSALAAGTALAMDSDTIILPVDGAVNIYLRFSDDVGDQGNAQYEIVGYFD